MKSVFFMFAAFALSTPVFAQKAVEEEIKKVVMLETEAYMKSDSVQWLALWKQDDFTFRSFTGLGFHSTQTGWKNFGPPLVEYMREGPIHPRPIKIQHDQFVVRIAGDMSWLSYNQKIFLKDKDSLPMSNSLETRTLMKEKGKWKIASIGTVDSLSYSSTSPERVENNFNSIGYAHLAEKKVREAIEIFKLNVVLSPASWNAYDSLGEAYIADGNRELAIKNYEKSVELNPKNETGIETLKKLKAQ